MSALRPAPDAGFVTRLALFLGVSVLSGLLVAGLALPVVGGLGLVARDSADGFDSLPAELEIPPLPERSRLLAADGSLIATFFYENRVSVPLTEVAPVMRKAVIAIEDARFYEHGGIDLRGTLRAFVNNQAGEDVQGGSTLTQQYVKQVLLEKAQNIKDPDKRRAEMRAATEQSYSRKLRELRFAVAIEEKYTKQQILERYLNIAYFGASAYGVEAAAKRYFRTTARDLTLAQAALLAGIVQQPTAFDPTRNPEAAMTRRNLVLSRMADTGLADVDEVAAAKAEPLNLKEQKRLGNGCDDSRVPFFCDFVLKTIHNDKVFGAERSDRTDLLLRGGLTITTTLDRTAQKAAQDAVAEYVDPKDAVASALVSVQPGTGHVRAMAVSRGFGDGKKKIQFNPATDRAYGGQQRLPGRLDVQAVRRGRGAGEGLPVQLLDLLAVPGRHRRRAGLRRDPLRRVEALQRDHQRERHLHPRRPASRGRSTPTSPSSRSGSVSAARSRSPSRWASARRRRPADARQVVHARHRRGVAAVHGRGLRELRRPRPALQLRRDPRGHRPRRHPAPGARAPTASRPSTRTSPTASTSCCRASCSAARAPGQRSAARRPARRARRTSGSRCGSSATPRSSRRRCGPATRPRRAAATRCRTGSSAGATTATSAVAACPGPSGGR